MKTPETHPHLTWDIIKPGMGTAEDDAEMTRGCHYNYGQQLWIDGHDHAHFHYDPVTGSDDTPLVFCGADLATCGR